MKKLQDELLQAIQLADKFKVTSLLKKVNPNFKNQFGNSPLHLAIDFNLLEIADLLLKHGADIDYKNNNLNETPLYLCVNKIHKDQVDQEQSLSAAKFLLKNGANPNLKRTRTDLSLLHDAVIHKDYKLVKLLLENGAFVDESKNTVNATPLCFPSTIEIVSLLISYGANVNHLQKNEKPLLFEYLELNNKQDPNDKMKDLILKEASLNESPIIERLELLIQDRNNESLMKILDKLKHLEKDLVNELGIYAVRWSNQEILIALLKLKLNANYYSNKQETSTLVEAIMYNDIDMVKLLVKNGAEYKKIPKNLRNRIDMQKLNTSIKELITIDS